LKKTVPLLVIGPPGSPPVVVQAGISLAARDREQRTVLLALGGGGALGLVLTLAGAFFLTGRALAPVQLAFDRQRRFVGDASHELRTPLALLRLEAESLAGRLDDRESTRPFLRQIDRTARLVDDLLTLAQIDERALPFEPEPVHVASLVEAAAAAGRSLAPADVTVAHAAPPDAWVSGDRDRLYRVLLILVDNACRAVAAGGRIEVRARAEQSSVVIEVSDPGRGIPRDQLARVFERFYRVDRARSRAAGGAGLGLSIAHEIVRAHAGTIVLDSTPGQGATATVRLARLPAPAPLAEETGAPALV
jgi:signal transduction histidine kinase